MRCRAFTDSLRTEMRKGIKMNDKAEFQARFQELAPFIYYGDIYENVQLSVSSKRPNDKVYAYCEVMPGAGNLAMIVCITDGCIECSYADSFEHAHVWSEKILDTICLLGMRMDWYAKYYMKKVDTENML